MKDCDAQMQAGVCSSTLPVLPQRVLKPARGVKIQNLVEQVRRELRQFVVAAPEIALSLVYHVSPPITNNLRTLHYPQPLIKANIL